MIKVTLRGETLQVPDSSPPLLKVLTLLMLLPTCNSVEVFPADSPSKHHAGALGVLREPRARTAAQLSAAACQAAGLAGRGAACRPAADTAEASAAVATAAARAGLGVCASTRERAAKVTDATCFPLQPWLHFLALGVQP